MDLSIKNTESPHHGSLGLDIALGVGGYPKGRVIEIYGPRECSCVTFES